jgi:endonuclease YncB( thermonuclease family)
MRTLTVTICLLAALFLGGGLSGDAWREVVSGAAGGDGSRGTAARVAAPCGGRAPPCDVRPPRDAWRAAVLRVVDGDTVILLVRGRPVRVRLIGVDAPETWYRRDCLGAEAARALRVLLPPGSPVRAAGDREAADRYGRRLLYLWAPGGPPRPRSSRRMVGGRPRLRRGPRAVAAYTDAVTRPAPAFVATSLIRAGLARAMYVPPDTRYAAALQAAESAARRSRAGLWAACAGR